MRGFSILTTLLTTLNRRKNTKTGVFLQMFGPQKQKIKNLQTLEIIEFTGFFRVAGAEGLEPSARGFGVQVSLLIYKGLSVF